MRSEIESCDPQQLAGLIDTETVSPASPLAEAAGTRIGRYKLLQLIGEGGFGSVFMAEQETPVVRKVALKVIKLGMDTKQVIARFEAERQALAMMDHPNIARVLDAGATDTGRPYFVMELVKGIPITEYCDRSNLTLRQRLELFIPVCKAVQHAHQKGIIHRDIKPSNVLVTLHDGTAVPKVIDFGIAKAVNQRLTEHTLFTEYRQLIGTPEYTSPEQADISGLDVDTRSDIYSLGVLLYQLLTGSTPFDSKQLRAGVYSEIQRIIREVEPPKPSTRLSTLGAGLQTLATRMATEPKKLGRLIAGELDWIVMKCLEKDRNRRYNTADSLADDVKRHLSGDPVEASPPSALYRLRKFSRKHRLAMSIASLLVCATVISSWQAVSATRARAIAQTAQRQAAHDRDQAVAEKQRADQQASVAQAINNFLNEDVLKQASTKHQGFGNLPDRDLKVREALDRAATRLPGPFKNQPLIEAKIRGTIGNAYLDLGEYKEAEKHLQAALELTHSTTAEESADSLQALSDIAGLYVDQARYVSAKPLLETVLDGRRRLLGDQNRDTLASLNDLGSLLLDLGEFDRAERLLRQALEGRQKILGDQDADTLETVEGIGSLYHHRGQLATAESLIVKVLNGRRATVGDQHPDTFASMTSLASLYREHGKYPEAESLLIDAREGNRKVLGPQHPQTFQCVIELANLYEQQGQFAKVEPLYMEAIEGIRKVRGELHPDMFQAIAELAYYYMNVRRYDEGERLDIQVLEGSRKVFGEEHRGTLGALGNLATLYHEQRQYTKAEPLFLEKLKRSRDKWGVLDPMTLSAEAELAYLYTDERRYAEAEPLFLHALEGQRKVMGERNDSTASTMNNLAVLYIRQGQYTKVEQLIQEAFELHRTTLGERHPSTLTNMGNLAGLYMDTGQLQKAEPLWRQLAEWALADPETFRLGKHLEAPAVALQRLVTCYRLLGQEAKAAEWGRKLHALVEVPLAKEIANQTAALTTRPSDPELLVGRGSANARLGRFRDAADDFAKAIEANPSDHTLWHQQASLLLELGEMAEYRRNCQMSLTRFGRTTDLPTAERIAKIYLMTPPVDAALPQAVAMVDRALAGRPDYEWYKLAKGMAEYRSGHLTEAITWLKSSTNGAASDLCAQAEFFTAMAYQSQGHKAEARAAMDRGMKLIAAQPRGGEGDLGTGFQNRIYALVAQREAEAMINGSAAAPTTTSASGQPAAGEHDPQKN